MKNMHFQTDELHAHPDLTKRERKRAFTNQIDESDRSPPTPLPFRNAPEIDGDGSPPPSSLAFGRNCTFSLTELNDRERRERDPPPPLESTGKCIRVLKFKCFSEFLLRKTLHCTLQNTHLRYVYLPYLGTQGVRVINHPQPLDPIVVTYELYVVDLP